MKNSKNSFDKVDCKMALRDLASLNFKEAASEILSLSEAERQSPEIRNVLAEVILNKGWEQCGTNSDLEFLKELDVESQYFLLMNDNKKILERLVGEVKPCIRSYTDESAAFKPYRSGYVFYEVVEKMPKKMRRSLYTDPSFVHNVTYYGSRYSDIMENRGYEMRHKMLKSLKKTDILPGKPMF